MVVDSRNVEFGYDLVAALPYAYWHHLNGSLRGTVSGTGSGPLYYFSPDHKENPEKRSFGNVAKARDIPNINIHRERLDTSMWVPPPLKEHYAPQAITFDKPTVVICNRYGNEWGMGAINFFDLPVLRKMFAALGGKYTVVYVHMKNTELRDDNELYDLGDIAMVREEFPEVVLMDDLAQEHGDYNRTQLRVLAGADKFIVMNGGLAFLSFYFGGEVLVYTKRCQEIGHNVNSYYNWCHLLGGSYISVVKDYDALMNRVVAWGDDIPLINVLTRCHRRPRGLARAIDSLTRQGYPNLRIVLSYDDDQTWKYVRKLPFTKVFVQGCLPNSRPSGEDYGNQFPANIYFNQMYPWVNTGYIMFLDDSDSHAPGSLHRISKELTQDRLVVWSAADQRNGDTLHASKDIRVKRIDTSQFAFHHSQKHLAWWEPWRRGDYRVAKRLSENLRVRLVPEELSLIGVRIDGSDDKDRRWAEYHRNEQIREELRGAGVHVP